MLEEWCCWWFVDVRRVMFCLVDVEEVVLLLEDWCRC